jgi:hypothetical protein
MNRFLKFISCAPLLALCIGFTTSNAQTVILPPVAANVPPVLVATIDSVPFAMVGDMVTAYGTATDGTSPYAYQWTTNVNGLVLIDPTLNNTQFTNTSSIEDQLKANPALAISLEVTDANSCLSQDSHPLYNAVVGLEDINTLDVEMNIYPNPNAGIFSVSLKGRPTGEEMNLVVLDALGRLVYKEQLARFQGSLNKELDLSGLSEGAYFLGFYSEGKQAFKKLMIH